MNYNFIELWHSTHSCLNNKHWHSGINENTILKNIPLDLSVNSLLKIKNPSDIINKILSHEIKIGNNPLASVIRLIKLNEKEIFVPDSCGKLIPSNDPNDKSFFIKVYLISSIDDNNQEILSNSSISLFCPSLGYQIYFINCNINHFNTDIKIGNYLAKEKVYKIIPEKCIIAYPDSDKINFQEILF